MIAENSPVEPAERGETPSYQTGPSFLTARSLVTPVAPEIWMSRWQPDDGIWKTAAKDVASS